MYTEEEFQRWSTAYQDSISPMWQATCPNRWRDLGDYDVEQDRRAFRRMELLRDIHDWAPLPQLGPEDQAALDLALKLAEVRQVADHVEITPAGFQLLTGHTLDRYMLLDWRTR
jgi:hypothetical protein